MMLLIMMIFLQNYELKFYATFFNIKKKLYFEIGYKIALQSVHPFSIYALTYKQHLIFFFALP